MKIAVLFKIIRDLESAVKDDWRQVHGADFDISYTKRVFNPFDEAALENALHIKDIAKDTELTAITLCEGDISAFSKTLYAIGFGKVIRLSCGEDLRLRQEMTAELLLTELAGADYDYIFTGMKASPMNTGLVPLYVARGLNYGYYPEALSVEPFNDCLAVKRDVGQGSLTQTAEKGSVIAFGNAERFYLRAATLMAKRRAAGLVPEERQVDIGSLSNRLPSPEGYSFLPSKNSRKGIMLGKEEFLQKIRHSK